MKGYTHTCEDGKRVTLCIQIDILIQSLKIFLSANLAILSYFKASFLSFFSLSPFFSRFSWCFVYSHHFHSLEW